MILVTGATGSVGRMVVDRLLEKGATNVRALTIDPKRAALPDGIEVVRGNIRRPETLGGVFQGVGRMYLAPSLDTVSEVVALARDAGVQHIVDLSGSADTDWLPIAEAVEASGVAWTHLAPGEFIENTFIWSDQIRNTGVVRDAYPDAANAMIAMDDIAEVAAVVLLEDGHVGRNYDMTGPESLTRAEQVQQIGVALGKDIPFIELSHDEAIEELSKVMGEYAGWYLQGKADLMENPQAATTAVADVLGRPAMTFAEWAARHADQFR